jgi:hypothetical protein
MEIYNCRAFQFSFRSVNFNDWLLDGRTRGRGSSPGGGKNFHFSMSSRPALGPTQPPIQWVLGAFLPGLKGPGREADHLVYTSTPP